MRTAGSTTLYPNRADDALSADDAARRNFGVFSARYGNVYTTRQARQLFDRAFGDVQPADGVWRLGERYVDALRPQIEPDGFPTPDAVIAARTDHLAAVRTMFLECDVLVFTLGLTEAWESTQDNTVYPVAPGVHGGSFDSQQYRFVNFSVDEVTTDLTTLIANARTINPMPRS